jgi:hypothetical protein
MRFYTMLPRMKKFLRYESYGSGAPRRGLLPKAPGYPYFKNAVGAEPALSCTRFPARSCLPIPTRVVQINFATARQGLQSLSSTESPTCKSTGRSTSFRSFWDKARSARFPSTGKMPSPHAMLNFAPCATPCEPSGFLAFSPVEISQLPVTATIWRESSSDDSGGR